MSQSREQQGGDEFPALEARILTCAIHQSKTRRRNGAGRRQLSMTIWASRKPMEERRDSDRPSWF
jgi:hypothetical protein